MFINLGLPNSDNCYLAHPFLQFDFSINYRQYCSHKLSKRLE